MTAVAPGWYQDAQGNTRWWDGVQWTGHVAPTAPPLGRQPQIHESRYVATTRQGMTGADVVLTIFTAGIWYLCVVLPRMAFGRRTVTKVRRTQ